MISSEISIKRTLRNEDSTLSGKVTTDIGGLTRWGICQKQYPALDIKTLSLEMAVSIYAKEYWAPLKIDKLNNQNMADIIYDMAVNAGKFTAIKLAQDSANQVSEYKLTVDGKIGPNTINILNKVDPTTWLKKYIQLRINYYTNLAQDPKYTEYLQGWINRANSYLSQEVAYA